MTNETFHRALFFLNGHAIILFASAYALLLFRLDSSALTCETPSLLCYKMFFLALFFVSPFFEGINFLLGRKGEPHRILSPPSFDHISHPNLTLLLSQPRPYYTNNISHLSFELTSLFVPAELTLC